MGDMTDSCRKLAGVVLALGLAACLPPRREPPAATFPSWAYAWDVSATPQIDDTPRQVPDGAASFSLARANDFFFAVDWHPTEHPPMPYVVARGRPPDVAACGSCHRAEGAGGPESCNLAGLPADYIVRQMADFKTGTRRPAGPPRPSLADYAKATTDADVAAAAAYFAALRPRPHLEVVEADTVPRTTVSGYLHVPAGDGSTEALGARILEVPEDAARFALHDTHAVFRVYVPRGSIARGKAIVTTGANKTSACEGCHGPDLRGGGIFPNIAGQWPSYVVRQIYEIQTGSRTGANAAVNMRPVVRRLAPDDLIDVAAYLATLPR